MATSTTVVMDAESRGEYIPIARQIATLRRNYWKIRSVKYFLEQKTIITDGS